MTWCSQPLYCVETIKNRTMNWAWVRKKNCQMINHLVHYWNRRSILSLQKSVSLKPSPFPRCANVNVLEDPRSKVNKVTYGWSAHDYRTLFVWTLYRQPSSVVFLNHASECASKLFSDHYSTAMCEHSVHELLYHRFCMLYSWYLCELLHILCSLSAFICKRFLFSTSSIQFA